MELNERQLRALELRRNGKKFREIGAALGVSTSRARELVERAQLLERQAAWTEGLPSRYVSALLARGINTRAQLATAAADGSLARMHGIGAKCYETIMEWLRK